VNPTLASLLLDLSGLSDVEAEELTYQEYIKLYTVRQTRCGMIGVRETHDGDAVIFYEDRFYHAFFTTVDKISRQYNKAKFDRVRGSRIRWIGEVIQGNIDGTSCWYISDSPASIVKRLYVVWDEYYLVWLNPRKKGGWRFSSAYVADHKYIRRKTTKGSCFWRKITPRD